jgi:hypothetical protein
MNIPSKNSEQRHPELEKWLILGSAALEYPRKMLHRHHRGSYYHNFDTISI